MTEREPVAVSWLLMRRETPGSPTVEESRAEFDALAGEVHRLRGLLRSTENQRNAAVDALDLAEQDLTDTVTARPGLRPWTPNRRTSATGIRISVKLCCNGCGTPLGDLVAHDMTVDEGGEFSDVRRECPVCLAAIVNKIENVLTGWMVGQALVNTAGATPSSEAEKLIAALQHVIATGHGERATEMP